MPPYRVLFMQGSHLDKIETVEADNDVAAIMVAARISPAQDVEIWRGHRRLARLRSTPSAMGVHKRKLAGEG